MEQVLYERPREKLRLRGVRSLTETELLQLIIGSGSAGMPVAKMARKAAEVLQKTKGAPNYEDFKTINGMGDATICRVLAALYLGSTKASQGVRQFTFDLGEIRKLRKRSVGFVTLDGNAAHLNTYIEAIDKTIATPLLARRIASKVLVDGAYGVAVVLYTPKSGAMQAGVSELAFVSDLQGIVSRLQIKLYGVQFVTKVSVQNLYKGKV